MYKLFRTVALDDECVNTQLLKTFFREEYDIITALNGHEAEDARKPIKRAKSRWDKTI